MNSLRTLALLLVATSFTAVAQKPSLVKDTEANGRVPYIHTIESSCPLSDAASCASHTNTFPAIPTGYRLVITYISARFPNAVSPANISLVLSNGLTASQPGYVAMNLQSPVCSAADTPICVSAAPVSFYVEQTLAPTIVVTTGTTRSYIDQNINTMRVTLVGYLISLT